MATALFMQFQDAPFYTTRAKHCNCIVHSILRYTLLYHPPHPKCKVQAGLQQTLFGPYFGMRILCVVGSRVRAVGSWCSEALCCRLTAATPPAAMVPRQLGQFLSKSINMEFARPESVESLILRKLKPSLVS